MPEPCPSPPSPTYRQGSLTVLGAPYGTHQLMSFKSGGAPVLVMSGSGLAAAGYTLVADESVAGELYACLAAKVS